ncbi:CamS family sex pheromone protein [Jeotgalibacillus haloalkalitolerans]|uniref:CamS family sex pheromone protein n=1 Tax=Jeotgalibacillus haloalkalitolerans TaxID=3104292 RepID=A0ABU5KRP9_9BACL|nr:CamS family sex pheromone protein [Jeotgalibacillus sp. HH7-29]MDZ5713491.1 CamS family sex pheromone protein [Jeotgalibacillus sp. HH7-29]
MKKWLAAATGTALLMSGCTPSFQQEDEVVQENAPENSEEQTVIIPNFQISDEYYRTLLPYEASPSRGMVVNNLNTNYDIAEFENGLMRVAQQNFSPEEYFFQAGQFLESDTISSWLNREFTDEQLAEYDMEPEENIGLNPVDNGEGTRAERAERSPIYLAHILEHNYFVKSAEDESKVRLGGIVIGLAMNSVYYYNNDGDPFGPTFEENIPQSRLEEEGQAMAAEVVSRIREIGANDPEKAELAEVPITVALFKQEPTSTVIPGNFFGYATADGGSNELGSWNEMNENYVLFPSQEARDNYRDDETAFLNFKQDIETYFPNFNSVIGTGLYRGDQLAQLQIDIPIQFYGKSEIVGFTQYIAGRLIDLFPEYFDIEVSITSINGPEALIIKEPDDTEPFVHIYEQ